ncbi:MAG: hypothetical protein GVY04_07745 [Cyanobacteria bacterium]|nr:hypothetical protein [Cyanobacteria bacterium GSL.Bin1]
MKEKGEWVNQAKKNNSLWNGQKLLGFILGAIGAIMLLNATSMDTTVTTTTGNRVSNIGLMQEQDQQTMTGGIILIVGVVLFALDKNKE